MPPKGPKGKKVRCPACGEPFTPDVDEHQGEDSKLDAHASGESQAKDRNSRGWAIPSAIWLTAVICVSCFQGCAGLASIGGSVGSWIQQKNALKQQQMFQNADVRGKDERTLDLLFLAGCLITIILTFFLGGEPVVPGLAAPSESWRSQPLLGMDWDPTLVGRRFFCCSFCLI
jgi:hypothetical protein